MTTAVVVPIRSFEAGKSRLGARLDPAGRAELLRAMAENVVAAAGPLPVAVVSDARDVRRWAAALGLTVLDDPGTLDLAAAAGLRWAATAGFGRVVIAHADLPLATTLAPVAVDGARPVVTAVPCHRDDGTPVLSLPTSATGFVFAYGPGSFRRHAAAARAAGLAFRVRRDPRLGHDVDAPEDLVGLPLPVAGTARRRALLGALSPSAEPMPERIEGSGGRAGHRGGASRPVASYLAPAGSGAVGVDLPVPGRALAIGAHPDDIDFGCGGTLAKWAAAGCAVTELVLTDGSKGTWDPKADRDSLIALRQQEQRAAAAALGATDVVFLGHTDGELASGLAEREEVCRVIRQARPDVVLGHDPWKRYRLHPDHRHAGFLAVEGIVAARDPHFFPEQGLAPHRPSALLLWEADEVDHLEDIEAFLPAKLAALLAHQSQWESTMGIADDPGAEENAFESRVRERAAEAGTAAGMALAEAFKRIDRL